MSEVQSENEEENISGKEDESEEIIENERYETKNEFDSQEVINQDMRSNTEENEAENHSETLTSNEKSINKKQKKKGIFHCMICSKEFDYISKLQNHEMTHTGVKPFQCQICKKSFARSNHLKMHAMSHTGEKPFQCESCGKSFIQSSNFKRHQLSHDDKKPFQCKECDKSFIFPFELKHD